MTTARAILPIVLLAAACKPPPDEAHHMPEADPARGLQVMARAGCGSCHTIPGLDWPRGRVGPTLRNFGERNLIAGHLPNRPDVLAAYLRNAPAVLPGTTMPAMPITEGESRDAAAYLYTLGDR